MAKKETKFNTEGLEEIITDQPVTEEAKQASAEILTEQQLNDLNTEVENERKFGDQGVRTFLEAGASSASFGLTDQVLTKLGGEEAKEAMRERRQRNEEAALAGNIAGIVAPTLASGGTSLLAKGASSGVKAAAKAGMFAEKLTAKQLAKLINETGRKKIITNIIKKSIPKATGSAVEGAFYGAGQLVSEDALGTAEFNAENLLATAGTGAMIGGAFGGVLGSAEALVPIVKNNKIVDVVSKKINTNIDKRMAGAKLAKLSPSEISKLKDTKWGQEIYDNIPKFFKDNLKLKVTDSTESLFKKSSAEMKRLGEEIGETALQIDKIAKGTSILPTKSKIALRVQNNLREVAEVFKKNPDELAKSNLNKIEKRIASWDDWLNDNNPIKAVEIKELKTNLQQAAKWNKSIDQIPLNGKLDRKVAESVRQEFLELADSVSTVDANLGEKLRGLNLDYGTSLEISNKFKRALNKESSSELLKFKDLLVADILTDISGGGLGLATGAVVTKKFLESDLKRKLILMSNVEKANLKVNKKITKGISNFMSGAKKAAAPTSTKILLNTSFQIPNENGRKRPKPKTKKEAFKALSEDLIELQENPTKLVEHLSKNALTLTGAAPNTTMALNSTISTAIQFLNSKLPKDASRGGGLFARKWEPSSVELAKFERYLEAVENPMSAIEDLESGSLTRESIEAIKVVYPDIYVRLQSEAMDQITQNQELDYNKRLQLGVLLDLPSDSSLLPENIAALQQTFTDLKQQRTAASKEEGAIETTQGGLEGITFAEDEKTQTEKVATRKS